MRLDTGNMIRQGSQSYRKERSESEQELPEISLYLDAKPTEVRLLFWPGHGSQCNVGKDMAFEDTEILFASVECWDPTLFSCMPESVKHIFVPQ